MIIITLYKGYDYSKLSKTGKESLIKQSQNYIVQNGKVYDTETGEDISHAYEHQWLVPKRKEFTIKSKEAYTSKQMLGEHEKENGQFVFAFYTMSKNMLEQYPNLKRADIARLMYLGTLIEWETCILKSGKGKAIKTVTRKNFYEVMKLSRKRGNALLKLLIDDGILFENADNELVMNRELFYRGRKESFGNKDINFTRMFRNTVQNIFEAVTSSELNNVAIIYMVLPYLNFHTNIVSHNPSEIDINKIKPMKLVELAEALGYKDYRKLKTNLNAVKLEDTSVFGFFENDNDRRFLKVVVNPRVVFAGNGEQLQAIKVLFNK